MEDALDALERGRAVNVPSVLDVLGAIIQHHTG